MLFSNLLVVTNRNVYKGIFVNNYYVIRKSSGKCRRGEP
jgi:hypothetical protein